MKSQKLLFVDLRDIFEPVIDILEDAIEGLFEKVLDRSDKT